jgi:hypothetical protein
MGARGWNGANGNEMHIIFLYRLRLLRRAMWPMGLLLKYNLIVIEIITKVNSRLKFLYRNRAWLNTMSRSTLASSLIQCYFDYCSTAWCASLSKSLQKRLQVLQNKTIRFIQNLGPRATINCDILESMNTLCVADRVRQLRLNHVFNIFFIILHINNL